MSLILTLFLIGLTEVAIHQFGGTTFLDILFRPLREQFAGNGYWHILLSNPCLGGALMLPMLCSRKAVTWVRNHVTTPAFVVTQNGRFRVPPIGLVAGAAMIGFLGIQVACTTILSDPKRSVIGLGLPMVLGTAFALRFLFLNLPGSKHTATITTPGGRLKLPDQDSGVIYVPPKGLLVLLRIGEEARLFKGNQVVYKRPNETALGFLCGSVLPRRFPTTFDLNAFLTVQLEVSVLVTDNGDQIDLNALGSEPPTYSTLQQTIHQLVRSRVAALLLNTPTVRELNAQITHLTDGVHKMVEFTPETLHERLLAWNGLRFQIEAAKASLRDVLVVEAENKSFEILGGLCHIAFEVNEIGISPQLTEVLAASQRQMKRAVQALADSEHLTDEAASALLKEIGELDLRPPELIAMLDLIERSGLDALTQEAALHPPIPEDAETFWAGTGVTGSGGEILKKTPYSVWGPR